MMTNPSQKAIRDKCFHPSGTFMEFTKEEVEQSIPSRFEKVVRKYPERIAVKTANQVLTYAELNAMANRVAHVILAEHGPRGEPIALLLENDASMMAGILGVMKSGNLFVILDPLNPAGRNAYILDDARPDFIVTDKTNISLATSLAQQRSSVLNLDTLGCEFAEENPRVSVSPNAVAHIIYTSGSTGQPKGVLRTHRNELHYTMCYTNFFRTCEKDRISLLGSLGSGQFIMSTWWALLNGAAVCPINLKKEGLIHLADWLIQQEITILYVGVAVFRNLITTLTGGEEFPNLRLIRLGSEVVWKSDVESFKKYFPPHCLLANALSISEAGVVRQCFIDDSTLTECETAPVGYAVENKEILLFDKDGARLGFNCAGEIAVKSRYLSPGYWRRPDLTRAKFLPDPTGGDERTYLTGDMGRMRADGCLEYMGRKDFQVKVRGYMVEIAEIETRLMDHPVLKEAAVVAQEQQSSGTRLVAYFVLNGHPGPSIGELRAFLKEKLPEHMIPYTFVMLERMPLTPNGKIDRKALPAPDITRPELDTAFIEPWTATERELAKIWAEILSLDRVGTADNFFDLGGHSLLATQVMSRIRAAFEVELPLRLFFDSPTVAGLARYLEVARSAERCEEGFSIRPVSRARELPVSFAQQRLWFLNQLDPGSATYQQPTALRLSGEINIDALHKTLNAIIARHETLRTVFATADGNPVQVVGEARSVELPVIDLGGWPTAERDAKLRDLLMGIARRPFDLSHDLMLRAALLRLTEKEHVLLLVTHYIACDGWSGALLLHEISVFYEAFSVGACPLLPDLPIQYVDFASWQRQCLQEEALEEQLSYWKKQLNDLPTLELPVDRPRPAVQSFRGANQSLVLSQSLTHRLKALSHDNGTTLFMTLLASFNVLLQRYTGQDDVVVGSPIAGRNRAEIEGLIGVFVNNLVLRTDLSGNPTFRELLGRVRTVALDAYAHHDVPFEKLVEELRPKRDLSRTPLFQIFLNMLGLEAPRLGLRGLAVERLLLPEPESRFDITLYVNEESSGIHLRIVYNTDLFEPATIIRMLDHYQILLSGVVANPDRLIADFSLLTEKDRNNASIRTQFVHPKNPFLEFGKEEIEQSIPSRFEKQVEQHPDHIAVRARSKQWTYNDLNITANQVAHAMLGWCEEKRIGLLFEHDAPMIAAILGISKAGKTYVPLDPVYPTERLAYILEDCQVGAILTDTSTLAVAKAAFKKAVFKRGVHLINMDEIDPTLPTSNPALPISPDTLAYILYTSGSTGRPKGVMQNHRNVLQHIRNYTNNLHLRSDDRLTLLSSYSFDAAVMDIFGALLNGAALYPMDLKREEPSGLIARTIEEKITVFHATPTVYRYLLASLTGEEDLSAIRFVVLGGEEVQKRDVDLFKRHFSSPAIFINGLGPTESTLALQYFADHKTEIPGDIVPVGYPVEDTEILLLDQAGKRTEVFGEIAIRSGHLALGYWQQPKMTAAAFFPDPEGRAKGIYRTGDMGRLLPDGSIAFMGRRDLQVKIRGFRIELGEIEAALGHHAGIRETVIVASEHADRAQRGLPVADGESEQPESEMQNSKSPDKRLVAYLVAKQEPAPTVSELRTFLTHRLPDYMIPSAFVLLDAMPLTPNGKIDRAALPTLAHDRPQLEETFVAPRNPTETALAEVWAEMLKLERVGVHDNFFELGGHSLLATRVVSRVRSALNVDLTLRAFFERPTVADLAETVMQNLAEKAELGEITHMLSDIESLSDEETQRLLAHETT